MKKIKRKIKKISTKVPEVNEKKISALEAARARRQELRDQGEDTSHKDPIEKLKEKPTSLRLSVNAKCYECCGGELPRSRIKYCNIFDCPLWAVRPRSKGITKQQCIDYVEPGVKTDSDSDEE